MAAGDTLLIFSPTCCEPPLSNPATCHARNQHPVLDFDDTTNESSHFSAVMPRHYGGGGLCIDIHWSATSSTTGNVVWSVAFEQIGDEHQNLDADGFAAAKSVTATVPTTSGLVSIDSVTCSDGVEIDAIEPGEGFRIRITRDASNGSDSMSGDAELILVEIREAP